LKVLAIPIPILFFITYTCIPGIFLITTEKVKNLQYLA